MIDDYHQQGPTRIIVAGPTPTVLNKDSFTKAIKSKAHQKSSMIPMDHMEMSKIRVRRRKPRQHRHTKNENGDGNNDATKDKKKVRFDLKFTQIHQYNHNKSHLQHRQQQQSGHTGDPTDDNDDSSNCSTTNDVDDDEEEEENNPEQSWKQRWYTVEDYSGFRKNLKEYAKMIVSIEEDQGRTGLDISLRWYHHIMARILHNIYQNVMSYPDNDRTVSSTPSSFKSSTSFVMDPGLRFDLYTIGERAPDLIGMEKYAVRTLARDGARRRATIVQQVLELQKQYNNQTNYDFYHSDTSSPSTTTACPTTKDLLPQREEAIRRVSMLISGPGRCMAWAIAQRCDPSKQQQQQQPQQNLLQL